MALVSGGGPGNTRGRHTALSNSKRESCLRVNRGCTSSAKGCGGLLRQRQGSDGPAVPEHRPDQRHAVTTLDALHETLHAEGLGSPCIIAVGDVLTALAALHEQASPPIRCAA